MSVALSNQSIPADDPANDQTLVGMIRHAFRKEMMQHDKQLPARVIAVDRVNGLATVQPIVMMVSSNGQMVSRSQVASVPIYSLGHSQFVINFPLQPGDFGWIKANDRDISLYMQAQGEAAPNTNRLHSFEDGVFFPDALKNFTLSGDDAANFVIQNNSGSVKLSMSGSTLTLQTALDKSVQIVMDGASVSIKAPTINLNTPNLVIANTAGATVANLSGSFAIVGTTLTHNGKNIGSTHAHVGVTTGSGDTGIPV
jgi:hypothetical protein